MKSSTSMLAQLFYVVEHFMILTQTEDRAASNAAQTAIAIRDYSGNRPLLNIGPHRQG
jgi:hypothetical protein